MVYPRAGGGTTTLSGMNPSSTGLSPRRRGNRAPARPFRVEHGSIPAQAGEPLRTSTTERTFGVYPRAGGGTAHFWAIADTTAGLSPRRRGNPDRRLTRRARSGSIPAQAGEPTRGPLTLLLAGVYPRAGGGTGAECPDQRSVSGLSPRRRGNRSAARERPSSSGSIPAQAGEPVGVPSGCGEVKVYPRAGGGTMKQSSYCDTAPGLSPRRRGNPGPGDVLHA